MKTIADVVRWIEGEAPFTPAFRKKVLGSVRKMKKLPHYDAPLDQIPADLAAFDAMWGRGPVRALPSGFTSKSQFADWRSQTRSALAGFWDSPRNIASVVPEDEWSSLLTNLEEIGVHPKKLIPVRVLAHAAREASLSPIEVTHAWLQGRVDAADTQGQYEALKAALAVIKKHRTSIAVPISADLGIPVKKSTKHCVRLELPDWFARDVKHWREESAEGIRKGFVMKRKRVRSPDRVDEVLRGVTYIYTAMATAGLLEREEDQSVLAMTNKVFLKEVINMELMGEFPWKQLAASTLFEYINNWRLFVRVCDYNSEHLATLIKSYDFKDVKVMSKARRAWVIDFLRDTDKQAALLGLPNSLFTEAKKAMLRYKDGSKYERDVAIALGIAACAAAIWTSLPLRISTLLQLTYGFNGADVKVHSPGQGLMLTTPPEIVKNGYSYENTVLTAKPGGDPRKIVEWFVGEVRPHLLDKHIESHLRNPDLLFGGVSYGRLSSIWRSVSLEAGIPMTPHLVRHAIATIMANEEGADFSLIAALLGDTEETVRRNYVVIDLDKKNMEGQRVLSKLHGKFLLRGES